MRQSMDPRLPVTFRMELHEIETMIVHLVDDMMGPMVYSTSTGPGLHHQLRAYRTEALRMR